MNNKSVTIQSNVLMEALADLEKKGLKSIRDKLLLAIPLSFFKEGTDFWWERSELEAEEDIKHGRVSRPYDNADDLIAALKQKTMQYDRSFRSKFQKNI